MSFHCRLGVVFLALFVSACAGGEGGTPTSPSVPTITVTDIFAGVGAVPGGALAVTWSNDGPDVIYRSEISFYSADIEVDTIAHELTHAVGARHQRNITAVMYPSKYGMSSYPADEAQILRRLMVTPQGTVCNDSDDQTWKEEACGDDSARINNPGLLPTHHAATKVVIHLRPALAGRFSDFQSAAQSSIATLGIEVSVVNDTSSTSSIPASAVVVVD
jgi:hypothetical protein